MWVTNIFPLTLLFFHTCFGWFIKWHEMALDLCKCLTPRVYFLLFLNTTNQGWVSWKLCHIWPAVKQKSYLVSKASWTFIQSNKCKTNTNHKQRCSDAGFIVIMVAGKGLWCPLSLELETVYIHFFAGILFQLVQFTFNNEQTSFNFMILENERWMVGMSEIYWIL